MRVCRGGLCSAPTSSIPFSSALCVKLTRSALELMTLPFKGAIVGCSHPQRQHRDPQLFGKADGCGGAAGSAVVDGDEQLRAAEHFAVAPEHTAGAVVILQHLDLIAGGKQSPIARDGSLVPAVRLRRAGDEGAQLCVLRAVGLCGEDGLGKILIVF